MGAEVETGIAEEATDTVKSPQKSPKDRSIRHKKHKKRKRHQFNAIRSQMEFYFGDANLSKDRFLKQLIDKDPYVLLEVFLTFNKMKALTSSVEDISKSLSNSELLELDESQQKVRRKTALPLDRNVDEKTIYVEALPPKADHDWVKSKFERFGPVAYVSLPKYAKSRKIKEFGFIEFEQESSVEKAIKAFKEFNGVLNMQEADPAELKSVKSYIKEQNDEESVTDDEGAKQTKKRHKTQDPDGQPKTKKIKTEDEDENSSATAADDEDNTTASETAEDATKEQSSENPALKKKHRKKKKTARNVEKRQIPTELNADAAYHDMKILPKRDWKRLRNKYLNLQREKIAELKRKAWKERKQVEQQLNENATEVVDSAIAPSSAKKSKPNERNLHKMSMNFYGAGEDENPFKSAGTAIKETKKNPALERAPLFSYEPGLIVEVGFLEPCVTVKEFKADMRQYPAVKYVDVKEGAMHAFLRLDSADSTEEFVRQVNCAEYKCKVLAGEGEDEYWKKIEQDREMKLNKQVKVPQKRGREKIKKLVMKHIRFGDDDEG